MTTVDFGNYYHGITFTLNEHQNGTKKINLA